MRADIRRRIIALEAAFARRGDKDAEQRFQALAAELDTLVASAKERIGAEDKALGARGTSDDCRTLVERDPDFACGLGRIEWANIA